MVSHDFLQKWANILEISFPVTLNIFFFDARQPQIPKTVFLSGIHVEVELQGYTNRKQI